MVCLVLLECWLHVYILCVCLCVYFHGYMRAHSIVEALGCCRISVVVLYSSLQCWLHVYTLCVFVCVYAYCVFVCVCIDT